MGPTNAVDVVHSIGSSRHSRSILGFRNTVLNHKLVQQHILIQKISHAQFDDYSLDSFIHVVLVMSDFFINATVPILQENTAYRIVIGHFSTFKSKESSNVSLIFNFFGQQLEH